MSDYKKAGSNALRSSQLLYPLLDCVHALLTRHDNNAETISVDFKATAERKTFKNRPRRQILFFCFPVCSEIL